MAGFDAPVVEIGDGRIRGTADARGLAFRGIPYGAPTGGVHRFAPPRPPAPWAGIRAADAFGARAPQVDRPYAPAFHWVTSATPQDEDCLFLNVFTPAASGRRPVMVWLHGGAFAHGSADVPVLDGGNLAARGDVVVVTLNHRLNLFGYLGAADLRDPTFADAGNAGMLDLVAALRWVRGNIAAFGGDPANVTLFGQSGGGAKVAVLMGMPAADGLFHRAIVQSASSGFRVAEPEDAARAVHRLLRGFGLDTGTAGRLREVPAKDLLAAMTAVNAAEAGPDRFRPVIDGRTLPRHPFEPVAPEGARHIPLLIGYADTEASFFVAEDAANFSLSLAQVTRRIGRYMHLDEAAAAALIEACRALHPAASPSEILIRLASDYSYRLPTTHGAERKAQQAGAPVYMYAFAWRSPAMDGRLQSPHTAEIPFVFGNVGIAAALTLDEPRAHALSDKVLAAWTAFARTGRPAAPGLPAWPAFTCAERDTMVLDDAPRIERDPAGADRRLMQRYPAFIPGSPPSYRAD